MPLYLAAAASRGVDLIQLVNQSCIVNGHLRVAGRYPEGLSVIEKLFYGIALE